MAALVSELRRPLAEILAASTRLAERLDGRADVSEDLRSIHTSGERLVRMVDRIGGGSQRGDVAGAAKEKQELSE